MNLTDIRFSAAPPWDRERGLLGWVSFNLSRAVRLDGIALRRTLDGHLILSFPARRDNQGRQHPYIRPIDDLTRQDIEGQVFSALNFLQDRGA
jgi:DNA-binding cell septation regulator SpoVG